MTEGVLTKHHQCIIVVYTMNEHLETGAETRTENVIVRLTPKEKNQLHEEAKKAGISASAFFRLLLRNWTDSLNFTPKG